MGSIARYVVNYFLAIDQLLNTILLGHPDETISSRLGRTIGKERYFWVGWLRRFVDTVFFFDKRVDRFLGEKVIVRHCELSVMPLEQQNFRSFTDYELWSWQDGDKFHSIKGVSCEMKDNNGRV